MGSTGGYRSPQNWTIEDKDYCFADNHPLYPNEPCIYVKMGTGNDYHDGDFDLGAYMPQEIYQKVISGEYQFILTGHGCFAKWQIIGKNNNTILKSIS